MDCITFWRSPCCVEWMIWGGERGALWKGGSEQKCTQAIFKLGYGKACPDKSRPCGLERDLCVHQSSLQLQCHHFHSKETGCEGQKGATVFSVWTIKEQGLLCVYSSHRVPQSIPHTHTVYSVKTTLWKCFIVKGSFGSRSNEVWYWVPQMIHVVVI